MAQLVPLPVSCRWRRRCSTRRTAADREQQAAGDRGGCRHGAPCSQFSPPRHSPAGGSSTPILARQSEDGKQANGEVRQLVAGGHQVAVSLIAPPGLCWRPAAG